MTAVVTIEHLRTQFGNLLIHEDLSLTLEREEILGVIGGSGSGKSVLMRTIIGLQKPVAGAITFSENVQRASQVGVLFQSGALYSALTVLENIMFPLQEIAKLPAAWATEIAWKRLLMVGLPASSAHKMPAELSGGMIKRAALARALALDPPLLFLDEPTAGLDPISAEGFDALLQELRRKLGLTIFMITHDLDSLVHLCDRVAVLLDKRAVVGSLQEIYNLDDPWVRSYFHGARGRALSKKEG